MLTAADLRQQFQRRGLRITPQRDLIFRLLEGAQAEHPSAEVLYVRAARAMPSLSLRTVYAILKELEHAGAIRPLDLGTGSMRYCATPVRHHHIVCTQCGKVKDVYVDVEPVEIPPDQRRGFQVKDQDVVFRAVCADCLA
jgi:Fur family peroxide stress response transcriptional regulator